jgi:hypothetical protein
MEIFPDISMDLNVRFGKLFDLLETGELMPWEVHGSG